MNFHRQLAAAMRASGGAGRPPFLVEFPGATYAYSLRDLDGTNPIVVNVRRSSDSAELAFSASDIMDSTLENWVGVGNTGYVETLYNQAGVGDIVQSDIGLQPRLVKNGEVILANGHPSIEFSGSDSLAGAHVVSNWLDFVFAQVRAVAPVAKVQFNASGTTRIYTFSNLRTQIQTNANYIEFTAASYSDPHVMGARARSGSSSYIYFQDQPRYTVGVTSSSGGNNITVSAEVFHELIIYNDPAHDTATMDAIYARFFDEYY